MKIEKCWDCGEKIDTDDTEDNFHFDYHDEMGDCVNLLCNSCYLNNHDSYL